MKAVMKCPVGGVSPVMVVARNANDITITQRECDCDIVAFFARYPLAWMAFRRTIKRMCHAEAYGGKIVPGAWIDDIGVSMMPLEELEKKVDEALKQLKYQKWKDEQEGKQGS